MPRKLLPLAFALAVVATACSQPSTTAEVAFGSGERFVPFVADALSDVGGHPSVVVNSDGLPIVAYLGFPEDTAAGAPPATRPVGSPSVPAVLLATASADGVWTRGAVVIEGQIPNVAVPFNPAFDGSIAEMTRGDVRGLQMVMDDEGDLHVVWGSEQGLFYAHGSSDPDSTTQFTVEQISTTPPVGPSIAVDPGGEPWIAFYTSTSPAGTLELATQNGDTWDVSTIAETGGCEGCRAAVAVTTEGTIVAYSEAGDGVSVAFNDGENGWVSFPVEATGGRGLDASVGPDGLALSYFAGDEVHLASGAATGPFETATVASVSQGSAEGTDAGTSVAVDDAGDVSVAWSDLDAGVGFAIGAAGAPAAVDLGANTVNGYSPSVAESADGATSYLAWYDEATDEANGGSNLVNGDLLVGLYGDPQELAIAAPSPTPTGAFVPPSPPPSQECTPVEDATVAVVAKGFTFTDGSCIEATAGEAFTIAFDNEDQGTMHNIEIFDGPDTSGTTLFEGDLVTGVAQANFEIPALDAGEYAFNCVVHPAAMIGKVNVVAAGGGQNGTTGATGSTGATGPTGTAEGVTTAVTAENVAFDTDTISLAPGGASVITFTNNDASVQHNIAIWQDDTQAVELFNGDLLTGPGEIDYEIPALDAGEYYFACIVHRTMNGSVVVG